MKYPKGVSKLFLVEIREGEYTFGVYVNDGRRIKRAGIKKLAKAFCEEHGIEMVALGEFAQAKTGVTEK